MPSAATAPAAPRHRSSRNGTAPARRGATTTPPRRAPAHRAAPAPRRAPVTRAAVRFVETSTNGLLDRLLRGRLWVGCIGALLAGIVFLNVSLLELNQEIARTSAKAAALDRQNSSLRAQVAGLDSTERIQRIAERRGMLFPPAGQYRYLTPDPSRDGALAAQRIIAPRPTAGTLAGQSRFATAPQVAQGAAQQGATTGTTYRSGAAGTRTTQTGSSAAAATTPPTAAAPVATHP